MKGKKGRTWISAWYTTVAIFNSWQMCFEFIIRGHELHYLIRSNAYLIVTITGSCKFEEKIPKH